MKALFIGIAAITLVPSAAYAQTTRTELAPGVELTTVIKKVGGFNTPSVTVVTVSVCDKTGDRPACTTETKVLGGRGFLETVTAPLTGALGDALHRPTRIITTLHGSTASASGGSSRADSTSEGGAGGSARSDSTSQGGNSRNDITAVADNYNPTTVRNNTDVSAYADNYAPTTVATDDAMIDSGNAYDSYNGSFNDTRINRPGIVILPPPPPLN